MADVPSIVPTPPPVPDVKLSHRLACVAASTILGLTQSLGLNLVSSNLGAIQGSLGATSSEVAWLTTAYFATALSASALLIKARIQFGLKVFGNIGLACFVVVAALHLVADHLSSAIAVRAALGFAAAPLSTLAVLYMLEAFPLRLAPMGLILGFAALQLGPALSRIVVDDLLRMGLWHGLFMVDVALACLAYATINAVSLRELPTQPSFARSDLPSFLLYSTGWALVCVALTQGRLHWWTDAPWLGACLAAGIGLLGLYVLFDLDQSRPLLDLRWLATPYMLRFAAGVLLFRIVLSEQSIGVVGLMNALGQSNEQMRELFGYVFGGTLIGIVITLPVALRGKAPWLGPLAAALVAVAAWIDSNATSLSRPQEFIASQVLLAVASSLFFAVSCLLGFGPVIRDGLRNIVSFLAVFSLTHNLGILLGSAWIGTYVADRTQWHYAALAQHLSATDPIVADRWQRLGYAISGAVGDRLARPIASLGLFWQQTFQQATVRAYDDAFQAIALLAAVMAFWTAVLAWRLMRHSEEPEEKAQ
jgi:MFS family permease